MRAASRDSSCRRGALAAGICAGGMVASTTPPTAKSGGPSPGATKAPRISKRSSERTRVPSVVSCGGVNCKITRAPTCSAERSRTGAGISSSGGSGSPGMPQAARTAARQHKVSSAGRTQHRGGRRKRGRWGSKSGKEMIASEDVPAEVLVFHDLRKLLLHVGRIDLDSFLLEVRPFEGNLIEQPLHDGMQPPRANVFGLLIDQRGK